MKKLKTKFWRIASKMVFNITTPYYKIKNKRLWKKLEDSQFLENLCINNHTFDLDKYLRLMKMVKRKYRK